MTLFTVDLYTKSWVLNLRCFQGLLIKWGSSHQGSPHRGQSKLSYSRPSHQTGKACSGRGRGSEIQSPSGLNLPTLWDHHRQLGLIVGACGNILNLSHHQKSINDFSKHMSFPSSQSHSEQVMKNWQPFVLGPLFVMESRPGAECLSLKFSSANGPQ